MSIRLSTKAWRICLKDYKANGPLEEMVIRRFRRQLRLEKMIQMNAPAVVLRHEWRMMEYIDRLIRNRYSLLADYVLANEEEMDDQGAERLLRAVFRK